MNGYPCKNAERGCPAKVLKSKDDGKYHEIENGTMGARHFCKYWPSKADGKTPQDVLAEQKKLMVSNEVKQEFQKIETEVAQNAAAEKQYSNNDIMNEISLIKIQVASIESAIKMFTKDVGEALAKMSYQKASSLK